MQKLSLVDETFDLNFTPEYTLSILVNQDGFSFSILDTIQNKIVCLFHQDTYTSEPEFQQKKIKTIYDEVELLSLPYKKTILHYSAPDKTLLVPVELFSQNSYAEIYRTTFDLDKNSEILNHFIPKLNTQVVFGINSQISSFLKEKHQNIDIQNDIRLSNISDIVQNETLIIRIYRKQLVLLSFNSKINLYNSFYYENENDMLFYIIGAVKSIGHEPVSILMEGMVNKYSNIYHILNQYFESVKIIEKSKKINYSYLLDKLPDARFINLFNSFTCEL